MGKSTASCFRIISCGCDSVDHDDLQTLESKGSSNRRGWSFRKKSAGSILNNSVTSEAPPPACKENQESISVSCQVQPDLAVAEKTTEIQQKDEKKTAFSSFVDSKVLDTQASREDESGVDSPPDETSIILIQTAIRGLLARQMLLKQKSVTKLQSVVRGHIVRSHAVGSLRCVQAIIKMQALVRARRACQSNGQSNKEAKATGTYSYVSIEKLLNNAFARQLMGTTPKTQPINIKCEPSKSDSAWKWLERWMSVLSPVSNEDPQVTEAAVEKHVDDLHSGDKDVDLGNSGRKEENLVVQIVANDKNMSSYDANDLDADSSKSSLPLSSHCNMQNSDQSEMRTELNEFSPSEMTKKDLVDVMEVDLLQKEERRTQDEILNEVMEVDLPQKEERQTQDEILNEVMEVDLPKKEERLTQDEKLNEVMEVDLPQKEDRRTQDEILNEVVEVEYLPPKEETGILQDAPESEILSTVQSETEVKKVSRKASNPAFVAAHSKFEELSSSATSAKVNPSPDPRVESSLDKASSANQDERGISECGTELSVTSTLDSPDRSEAGVNNGGMDVKASDETDSPRNREKNLELEAKPVELETDPSANNTAVLERYESAVSVFDEPLNSRIVMDKPPLVKPEDPKPLQVELKSETSHQVSTLSPEASPRSHVTIPESQATPSSQVSVKSNKRKGGKSRSNRKSKPSSDDKNHSNHNQESAPRRSLEQLQEHKSGKRRDSLGSPKPDRAEQEPRDSSSSNSVPSYMQATKSARAKVIANGSPRSSPDVQDKDIYIKKRHSLPGTDERQGSPRVHRSPSQAQQNTKGNASQSPQDRKWRR